MFKKHFSSALWLGILNLPLAWFYSLAYTPQGETPWFVLVTFIFAVTGQLFIYFTFISMLLILPVVNWRRHVGPISVAYTLLILVIAHLLVNIDTHVFELYDSHLLNFITEIKANGINWSEINWMHWGIQLIIALGFSSVSLLLAITFAIHNVRCWPFALTAILMYVISTGIFTFSNSRQVTPLVQLERHYLPSFINISNILSQNAWLKMDVNEPLLEPALQDNGPAPYSTPLNANEQSILNNAQPSLEQLENNYLEDEAETVATSSAEGVLQDADLTRSQVSDTVLTPTEAQSRSMPNQNANDIDAAMQAAKNATLNNSGALTTPEQGQSYSHPATTDQARDPKDFAPFAAPNQP